MNKALVFWGGWDGHEPESVAALFGEILSEEGFQVSVFHGTNCLAEEDLSSYSLIVPVVTMSTIESAESQAVIKAVRDSGVGMAGCHGGMCDSFRNDTDWQFMTGGQWVAHPGDDKVNYEIRFTNVTHPITEGLANFSVTSEQYYLHTDPGNTVLATTHFPHPGVGGPHEANPCEMPQVWVKQFGTGRVFYFAVGHNRAVLEESTPKELMRRGFRWAAR
ncbi:MAG TPA: ThuA domain-containing protein [Fimbriimonadaceae bacterium]|nr:ThuA domain-containing protein [Fimbriimonadaceae bacterium]